MYIEKEKTLKRAVGRLEAAAPNGVAAEALHTVGVLLLAIWPDLEEAEEPNPSAADLTDAEREQVADALAGR